MYILGFICIVFRIRLLLNVCRSFGFKYQELGSSTRVEIVVIKTKKIMV